MNNSLSTLSLERLTMKKGTIIIWNGKPHTFLGYVIDLYQFNGRPQVDALLEEHLDNLHSRVMLVSVKDAFNKMEHQILTTI